MKGALVLIWTTLLYSANYLLVSFDKLHKPARTKERQLLGCACLSPFGLLHPLALMTSQEVTLRVTTLGILLGPSYKASSCNYV